MFYAFSLALVAIYKFFYRAACWIFPDRLLEKEVKYNYSTWGIQLNGSRPFDIVVHNPKFYRRVAIGYTLGMGESYMEGWWDTEDMVELFCQLNRAGPFIPWHQRFIDWAGFKTSNRQVKELSKEIAEKHYNLGNDFFQSFLDSSMNYSCGYWAKADNLDQAQIDKMDLIARKLKLKPGMKVLDIGCGWGAMAKHLAQNYGVSVVGYNISKDQVEYARRNCEGLPVEIRLEDYRNVNEKFDRIYSVGFFEHVGRKNYRPFFEITNRCLVDDGLHLIQSITILHKHMITSDEWVNTYIFPHSQLPYDTDYSDYSQGLFFIEDMHNFGDDYRRTLLAWHQRFEQNWPKFKDTYGEKFYRMWRMYLLSSAGCFKSRRVNLLQVVMSKDGLAGGYRSVR
ncbi:unnamed protein product [Cyprideis torosa]|uniref:Uncharacterized protein n=1 Tax=Cyprideis torosa TaxID=163714 RepID=A0A7R8W2R6_9CRUS|nr:unnamed protein product [Cyprideis torosa]CAG0882248.1 unnamed protein product [Cyprideis torosa]